VQAFSNTSHVIALPKDVADKALKPGDILGAFNPEGTCCGIMEFDGNATAITVFGDDPTTGNTDGFLPNQWISFRAYRPATDEIFELAPEYDASIGETGYFIANGLSVISGLKAAATGVENAVQNQIRIYPNPTNGVVNVEGIPANSKVEITDAGGQVVYRSNTGGNQSIDFSNRAGGLYTIRIISEKFTAIRKIMVE
jgi:hypothetical protein